jgi:hypothetical protein
MADNLEGMAFDVYEILLFFNKLQIDLLFREEFFRI